MRMNKKTQSDRENDDILKDERDKMVIFKDTEKKFYDFLNHNHGICRHAGDNISLWKQAVWLFVISKSFHGCQSNQ